MLAEATTSYTAADDGVLARLRAGDQGAYETFVLEHRARLLSTARRYFTNEADAEDAVQDTFLAVFRSIDGFGGHAKLSTWLHRILVNCCLMKLRSRRRRPEESLADVTGEDGSVDWPVADSPWNTPVESDVHGEEMRAALRSCIARLPETYRTVLQLRVVEALDGDEVGMRLGVSPNAVKIRLHRARQALRMLLDEQLGGELRERTTGAAVVAHSSWRPTNTSRDSHATRRTRSTRSTSSRRAVRCALEGR